MSAEPLAWTEAAVSTGAQDAAWHRLVEADSAEQLCAAWLAVLCRELTPVRSGLVLLADGDGSFVPIAVWPPGRELSHLSDIAREALGKREGVSARDARGSASCAYPLLQGEQLRGSVVLDLGNVGEAELAHAMQLVHWGAGWLLELFSQREQQLLRRRTVELGELLDLLLGAQGAASFREATLAIVNRLGQRFGCHQVQLGIDRRRSIRIVAVSHSAWFDERTGLVHLALQAMNEAFDQRTRVVWPQQGADSPVVSTAHRRYADESGSAAVCSLPLEAAGRVVGVLTLERAEPFGADELQALDTAAAALASTVEMRREAAEGLLAHARRVGRRGLMRITDTSHPGLKLLFTFAAVALVGLALLPVGYRIAAPASVEGSLQRAAVAPFEGYLREAPARAGDIVKAGQLLARLEDKDLKLEQVRWEAELEVAQRKEREAMAAGNRVNQRLAAAQANQARAQLGLVTERLARVQITAPLDAVVVKGDLSQQLGSPVQQGQVLFELAPLDSWRVILKVDERDIALVQPGQAGELALSSIPGQTWQLTVRKLTPVSVAEEGHNFFRVEAELGSEAPKLSPNMEGVAKVAVGERSLLWIWTHRLVDWLRLGWWRLMP